MYLAHSGGYLLGIVYTKTAECVVMLISNKWVNQCHTVCLASSESKGIEDSVKRNVQWDEKTLESEDRNRKNNANLESTSCFCFNLFNFVVVSIKKNHNCEKGGSDGIGFMCTL